MNVTTRTLQLACGDHSFPVLDHDSVIKLVGMMGFRGFDLGMLGNRSHLQPEQVRADVRGWADRLGAKISDAGLRVADLFHIPWTDFETLAANHPDADERTAARSLFRDMLDLAARLDSPGITVVPGVVFAGDRPGASFERAAEELQWRAEQARALGLRCSIEAHIGSVVDTPEKVLALLDLAPDLELTLDYTHFVAQGIAEERIHPLCARARHVHARGARPGRGQCAMKDNAIDYERVVHELLDHDYDGYIAAEYVWIEWEHMNECDNVSESLLMRDRLNACFAGKPWSYVGAPT